MMEEINKIYKPVARFGEGNGNPLQYSCLENPRDGGAWWAVVYGVAQRRTRLKRLSSSSNQAYQEEKTQDSNKVRNERGEMTTNTTEMQKIRRKYSEQLHANKLCGEPACSRPKKALGSP